MKEEAVVKRESNPSLSSQSPLIVTPKIEIAVPKTEPSLEKSMFARVSSQTIPRSPIHSDLFYLENDFYLDIHRFDLFCDLRCRKPSITAFPFDLEVVDRENSHF